MANNSDGSIIIDTELDNDGFDKGSDKLLKAVQDLASAVDNLGDNMMDSFSRVIPLLQTIAGSASSIGVAIGGTATQAADAGERIAQAERDVADAARQAQQATGQQQQAMSGIAQGASGAQANAASLAHEIERLSSGIDSMSRSAESGFSSASAVLTFDNRLTEMQSKLDVAREKLAEFAQTQIPTDDYRWLETEIGKVEKEYDRLLERQAQMSETGVSANSQAWKTLEYQIARNRQMLAEYQADMDDLKNSGGAYTTGAQTQEYAKMAAEIQRIEEVLERNRTLIDQEALAQARLNVQTAQEAVLAAKTTSERNAALERLRDAQSEINSLAASMTNNASQGPSEDSVSGWQRFGSALRSAASSAAHLASNLARIGFRAVASGFKSVISKVRQLATESHKTSLTTNGLVKSLTSIKRLLITRIKRMFISSIFNGVKESLQSLAQFSSTFNTAMSNIKNSATQLKSNLAVSLGSLISAIEPVLTRIINLISTAISYLNSFFALLGGRSTITVAKKQTDDYAKSLSSASGAAEKLKRQVYGFDELNKRSSSSSSSGGSGGSSGDLFEEVPIEDLLPDYVSDFFNQLKKAFEEGDWEGIGEIIAGGANSVLDKVDRWITTTAHPWLQKWSGRLADVFNGFTKKFNWTKLGSTIANALNTIFRAFNNFLKKFNAKKFGRGIGETVKSFFTNVDWKLIGETFANKWNLLLHTIEGFVTTPGIWAKIGTAIGNFIKSWFSNIDINSAATTVISFINGVAETIRSFLEQKPFEGVAEKLSGAINRILHEVNWIELAASLSDLFMTLLGTFADVVAQIDWFALGKAIGDFLGNIDWWGIFTTVAEIIWNAVTGVLSGLLSTDGGRIFPFLVGLIKGLKIVWALCKNDWISSITSWGGAIGSKLSSVVTGWGSALKSQITNFTVAGKTLLTGAAGTLATAALGAFDAVMIAYDVNKLKEAHHVYEEAQQAHTNETETALRLYAQLYKDKGKEVADEWASMVYQIDTTNMTFDQAQQALTAKIEGYWEGVPQNMWDGFKAGWNDYFGENGKGLGTLMGDAFDGAVEGVEDILGIHSPSTVFRDIGINIVKGLQNGIVNSWGSIKNQFNSLVQKLITDAKKTLGVHSPSTVFRGIGENVDKGLVDGLLDGKRAVQSAVSSVTEGMPESVDLDIPEITASADNMMSGFDRVANRLTDIADTFRVISASLVEMGGLKIPQIALGSVVPAKTKIEPEAISGVAMSDEFQSFSADVDERMADQTYVLRQILDAIKSLNLNIDLDALTRMLTKQQRERSLNYGGAL